MQKTDKIYIAGHRGLAGSAIVRSLTAEGYTNLITRTRQELDLLDANAVQDFFATEQPDYVFLTAAKRYEKRDGQSMDTKIATNYQSLTTHVAEKVDAALPKVTTITLNGTADVEKNVDIILEQVIRNT